MDTSPRQAGYKAGNYSVTGELAQRCNSDSSILMCSVGISLMHDEGTGGTATGGWGVFPLFPLADCDFNSCPVGINDRSVFTEVLSNELAFMSNRYRKVKRTEGDSASPGYFTSTLTTGIQIETTSTRRAGLIRFTYPARSDSTHVVVDLTNDLQRSFHGGSLSLDPDAGRIELEGTFLQSYGTYNYTAYACYDFPTDTLIASGTYANGTVSENGTSVAYDYNANGYAGLNAGALLSFAGGDNGSVTLRFGVSMLSSAQACANAKAEVPGLDSAVSISLLRRADGTIRLKVHPRHGIPPSKPLRQLGKRA